MADFTGFLSTLLVAWPDDVDLPQFADVLTEKNGINTTRFDVSYYLNDTMTLDDTDVRTVTWPTTGTTQTAMTKFIWARVIGSAVITHTGTDPNGAGATTTLIPLHGTAKMPAIGLLHATGLSGSFTVTGEADDTTVELFAAII